MSEDSAAPKRIQRQQVAAFRQWQKNSVRTHCMTFAENICPVLDRGIMKDSCCLCVQSKNHGNVHNCGHCGYRWVAGQESTEIVEAHRQRLREMLTAGNG